ncbi:AAA family ATPase [Neolewinella antarctica]|uniref:YhaN AAA domain-containing protein n=1 Tax=Neolewinella antarctica TaxID=442734 RepID=A0ABX0XH29_9BACT|nr:AAA family ATPase [Neolewinella antarctica]NJC28512.1 hypothetical protein [Neolewinella antarctica]
MRIVNLSLTNFRSVYGTQKVDFTKSGKSLVIYGENGAGKSSVCKSIDLFFEATDKRKTHTLLSPHINIFAAKEFDSTPIVEITLKFTDGNTYVFDAFGHAGDTDSLKLARNFKGVLDYKSLMPIYFSKVQKNKLNLYRYFVNSALPNVRNPLTNSLIKTHARKKYEDLPANFLQGVYSIIIGLSDEINMFLKYFDEGLEIEFKQRKTFKTPEIYISVSIDGNHITTDYSNFLNEARLVALALSVNLAVISHYNRDKTEERAPNTDEVPKLLLMDDVFIGMDLINRLPFLKILKEHFGEYQKIITTYDRGWYSLMKDQLGETEWKFIEVFRSRGDKPSTEVLDREEQSYIDLANYHFDHFDYPASANYLRKAFEEIFKDKLPENLLRSENQDGSISRNAKTRTDFSNFKKYLKSAKVDISELEKYDVFTRIILNPLSHDDKSSPIFRKEIENIFSLYNLYKSVNILTKKKITNDNSSIVHLTIKDIDNNYHNYKVQLREPFKMIDFDGNSGYLPCAANIISYKFNKEGWIEEYSRTDSLQKIYRNLNEKHGVEVGEYLDSYKTHKGVVLSAL